MVEESDLDRYLDVMCELIDKRTDSYVARLKELVAIPSVSEDPDHRLDVIKALRWCGIRLKSIGFSTYYRKLGMETIYEGDQLPLHPTDRVELPPVLCASLGDDVTKRTVLIYGHIDVKSAKPPPTACPSDAEPFQLTVRNGFMFGRGVADDKGPVVGWINAIEAFQKCKLELPVNVRFLIESGEETGSENLRELLLEMKKDFLKDIDFVVMSDSTWLNMNTPCLTYGLRGLLYFHVHVRGSDRLLHSGSHGGAIQEPLIDLEALMCSLLGADGKLLVPGIYDFVRRPEPTEIEELKKLDFDASTYARQIQSTALHSRDKVELLRRRWLLPSVEFHGIEKSFDTIGAPTLVPNSVMGKFSLRLVPDQNPRVVAERVKCYLQEVHARRCSGNLLHVKSFRSTRAFLADRSSPNFIAAREAVRRVWKRPPDLIRDGATIAMAPILEEVTNCDVVLIPMGECQDNVHETGECMSVRNYINGIKVFATYLNKLRSVEVDYDENLKRQNQRMKWYKSFW